jgi:hypothetical protein
MNITYREIKVSNGEGISIPDTRGSDIQLIQRDDSAYICWWEYTARAGPIVNDNIELAGGKA